MSLRGALPAVAILICGLIAGKAAADPPCVDYSAWLHEAGFLDMWSVEGGSAAPQRLELEGHHLYFYDRDSYAGVIDVSDPRRPVLLPGRMYHDSSSEAFALADGHVYIAYDNGVVIFDVSDPAAPRQVAFLPTASVITDIVVIGSRAYVSRGDDGTVEDPLDIVDVSDPSAPRVVRTLAGMAAYRSVVSGNRLYAAGGMRLVVKDITDPDQPTVLGTWDPRTIGHYPVALTVVGDTVYLPCGGGELLIVDWADPSTPTVLSTWNPEGFECGSIAVSGSLALVGGGRYDDGMMVLDVSDPSAPVALGSKVPTPWLTEVIISDGLAYLGSHAEFLRVLDISSTEVFPGYEWHDTEAPVAAVCATADPDVCLMLVGSDLRAVDLGAAGAIVASLRLPGSPQRIAAVGNRALVACDGGGLVAFDITDPRAPLALGAVSGIPEAVDVVPGGGGVVALAEGGPLWVVDPDGAPVPVVIGSLPIGIPAWRVAVDGDIAYLGASEQIQSVDLSDPTHPVSRWTTAGPWTMDLELVARDGLLYFIHPAATVIYADNGAGVDMLAVSPYGGGGWASDADVVYMAGTDYGLEVLDFVDPVAPYPVGLVTAAESLDRWSQCVAVVGDRIVVGFEPNGFLVTPRHCPATVGVEVAAFTAAIDGASVRLHWTANGASSSFRVVARSTAGDRILGSRFLGNGHFEARDDVTPSPGTVVSYVLEREDSPGTWVALATTGFTVPPSVVSPRLAGCVPNPFNPGTRVDFTLPAAAHAVVTVHDAAGRQVAVLADRRFEAGPQSLAWDGRDTAGRAAASGVYLVRLRVGVAVDQGKMLLVR
jgi:hypothetical protein